MNNCTHTACNKTFNSHLIIKNLQNLNRNDNMYINISINMEMREAKKSVGKVGIR